MSALLRKVLVANRGEIALRVVRACREMGVGSVAVYSDVDAAALHVRLADECAHLGPAPAAQSYLNVGRILEVARARGCDAIHPGYGFLSENEGFARAVTEAGLVWIGPPPEAIEVMGDKAAARRAAIAAGVPVVPGTDELRDVAEAAREAERIGYPVMLKAVGGGGGKGMRVIEGPERLESAFAAASREARAAFGVGALYLEKLLVGVRHVEVQVLADAHGAVAHLGERECSLQRRHQKLVEESPSPSVTPALRERMGAAAVASARAVGYRNAGTVEFLLLPDGQFYFLEMNTRLQVEHPVTELVTGIDLVQQQLLIAAGEPLALRQEQLSPRGWAIECRITAEDARNGFLPATGRVTHLREPAGPGVRVDSSLYPGLEVTTHYDSLLSKLIAWAPTRDQATRRLRRALDEYLVAGLPTSLPFHRALLADPRFATAEFDTAFVEERFHMPDAPQGLVEEAALGAALEQARGHAAPAAADGHAPVSGWKLAARQEALRSR